MRVNFVKENVSIEVKEGTSLLEAEILAGLAPDSPCGGKGKCGKCEVLVSRKCEDGLPGEPAEKVLACRFFVSEDVNVATLTKGANGQAGFEPEKEAGKPAPGEGRRYGAAVDIGTTSIVCFLMDLDSRQELSHASALNPQVQFGADVISRIEYSVENGPDRLTGCVRETICGLLEETAASAGIKTSEIERAVFVGNTCMHHLFLGISPASLAAAPFEPMVKEAVTLKADELGLKTIPGAEVTVLPNIAGFVGADTVGCMAAAEFDKREDLTLLIDIGTNGEIVLGRKDFSLACSTAAGPAFEGAKIECGMRAVEGAISHVSLENGKIKCSVIPERSVNQEASGLCGSGLLDAVAVLLKTGNIDETGKLCTEDDSSRFYLKDEVYISQKDVREMQLAKGAIAAGIELLAKEAGVQVSDIETVLIAGAFGNYMDPESAFITGLIPKELYGRVQHIGNAAGEGAKKVLLDREELETASRLAKETKHIELAGSEDFQDVFVDNLGFE